MVVFEPVGVTLTVDLLLVHDGRTDGRGRFSYQFSPFRFVLIQMKAKATYLCGVPEGFVLPDVYFRQSVEIPYLAT